MVIDCLDALILYVGLVSIYVEIITDNNTECQIWVYISSSIDTPELNSHVVTLNLVMLDRTLISAV